MEALALRAIGAAAHSDLPRTTKAAGDVGVAALCTEHQRSLTHWSCQKKCSQYACPVAFNNLVNRSGLLPLDA
jgi:hypothetical protein